MRIVVNGQVWGTIGFDEMVHEREWTAVEVDVIRIASNVLGAAIKRQKDEEALQYELTQRKQLIDELELNNDYKIESMGFIKLRGKEKELELFAVEEK